MPYPDLEQPVARADLCRFLAACYYEPGPEFAEEKVFDSMLDAAMRIHPDLAEGARRLGAAYVTEGCNTLLVDYARLFLGPVNAIAKPYGSVWMDEKGALMGESTMSVAAMYEEGGFELDEEFREPPDHVAAELEFLYLLIYREREARRDNTSHALKAAIDRKKHFLRDHLGLWIGPFTAAVKAGARSSFYRELAELTERFVAMEKNGTGAARDSAS